MSQTPLFLLVASLSASAACFSPKVSEGVICGNDESCPAGMLCDPLDNKCRFVLRDASPPSFDAEPPAPPAPNVRIDPEDVNYGSVGAGNVSANLSFIVINFGDADSKPLDVSINPAESYTIIASTCQDNVLQPMGSCTVTVAFSPVSVGDAPAQLQVSDADTVSENAALLGTGFLPGDLKVTPTSANFGSVSIGDQSTPIRFTLKNEGGVDTTQISTFSTGADSANFQIESNNCTGMTLAPMATCTLDVVFSPTEGGSLNASLEVSATTGGLDVASIVGIGNVSLTTMNAGSGQELGLIQSSPAGINCGSTCDAGFSVGTVTLTATPTYPAVFKNWVGADPSCTAALSCDVTMDVSKVVTANWDYCSPGMFLRCDGTATLIQCASDGGGEEPVQCDEGCNTMGKRCNECIPGESTCVNNTQYVCDDDGTLSGVGIPCPSGCGENGMTCKSFWIIDGGAAES